MPKNVDFREDGFERAWFTLVGNSETLEEAMCFIKGFAEEAILSHNIIIVEIHIRKRLPQQNISDITTS